MFDRAPLDHDGIVAGFEALDLKGAPVAVHTALSSFGNVLGGARTVAEALVDVCGTVLAPTFCSIGRCGPPADAPPEMVPTRNGIDIEFHAGLIPPARNAFDPERFGCGAAVDRSMGAVPRALLAFEGAVRSDHPSRSWVVVGDRSGAYATPHPPDRPLAPLERLFDESGVVLLLGVSLTRCTAVHLAESRAGRAAFVRWIRYADGAVRAVREPGCSDGFDRLTPYLEPLARRVMIGRCTAAAYPIRPLIDFAADRIRADPRITHCESSFGCARCEDAMLGGPKPP